MESAMVLSRNEAEAYERDGFVLKEGLFTEQEIAQVCDALDEDVKSGGPEVVYENDGCTLRAVYASHLRHPLFQRLITDHRLLEAAEQLTEEGLYIHQMKVNIKQPFGGEGWSWHQDYIVWRDADGMPRPSQVNVAILLDDSTEFNGPLIFLKGSHALGTLERPDASPESRTPGHIDPASYAIQPDEMQSLSKNHEMFSVQGKRGSALFFSPQMVHGSNVNISPTPRRLLILTYNPVRLAPVGEENPREEYLVGVPHKTLRSSTQALINR